MDHDPRFAAPVRTLRLAPLQVMALGLLAVAVAGAAWTLRVRPAREDAELLPGSVLPQSELAIMEAAFDRAQLTDHRTEGGRVYVPRERHSAYMRALVDAEALPREFGASLRRALAANGPWTSAALRADSLRVAIQDELSLVLCSMPGIERAAVLYDDAPRSGLAGGQERTASVSISTQPDHELDPARVQAIRVMVAAAIAGLPPERVAVTDLRSGRVHAGPLEPAAGQADPARAARDVEERAAAAKIRQGLGFIRGLVVDVTIGPASDAPAGPPAEDSAGGVNSPAVVGAAAPSSVGLRADSVHVLVAVPDAYLESVVAAAHARRERRGQPAWSEEDREQAEAAEIERLTGLVKSMLPEGAIPGRARIVVTPFAAGLSAVRTSGSASRAGEPTPPERAADASAWSVDSAFAAVPAEMRQPLSLAAFCVVALAAAAVLWRGGSRRRADESSGGAAIVTLEGAPAARASGPPVRWQEAA